MVDRMFARLFDPHCCEDGCLVIQQSHCSVSCNFTDESFMLIPLVLPPWWLSSSAEPSCLVRRGYSLDASLIQKMEGELLGLTGACCPFDLRA